MEKIGSALKERRIQLGYSLQEMNEKTKLSISQLEAIERGDIAYFKEDLSYLSYFVRYYANALNMNYDELRDDMDTTISEYTASISLSQIKKQESINNNIRNKSDSKPKFHSTVMKPKKKIIDFRTFGLIAIAIAIVASLGFILVKYVPTWLNQDPIERPIIQVPGEEEETPPEEETPGGEVEETPATLEIVMVDPNSYEIRGLNANDPAELKVIFAERSWTQFRLNNVKMTDPKEAIYEAGTEAIVKTAVADQTVVSISFGRLKGNTLEINGTPIVLDASVADAIVANISFKFVVGG